MVRNIVKNLHPQQKEIKKTIKNIRKKKHLSKKEKKSRPFWRMKNLFEICLKGIKTK